MFLLLSLSLHYISKEVLCSAKFVCFFFSGFFSLGFNSISREKKKKNIILPTRGVFPLFSLSLYSISYELHCSAN